MSDQEGRRYAVRGVERERLRLRIDRRIAARLRTMAAAHGLSVNAFAESVLAGHLTGDTGQASDLSHTTGLVRRPAAFPVDSPTRATKT